MSLATISDHFDAITRACVSLGPFFADAIAITINQAPVARIYISAGIIYCYPGYSVQLSFLEDIR